MIEQGRVCHGKMMPLPLPLVKLTTALSSVMAATMASWSQRIQLSPHGQLRNLLQMRMRMMTSMRTTVMTTMMTMLMTTAMAAMIPTMMITMMTPAMTVMTMVTRERR